MTRHPRRQDDRQLPRQNHEPTHYYLVAGKSDGKFLDQRIIDTFEHEDEAIRALKFYPKAIVSDCRDWVVEELAQGYRSLWLDHD